MPGKCDRLALRLYVQCEDLVAAEQISSLHPKLRHPCLELRPATLSVVIVQGQESELLRKSPSLRLPGHILPSNTERLDEGI